MGGPRKTKVVAGVETATIHNNLDPLVANMGHQNGMAKLTEKAKFIEWLALPEDSRPDDIKTVSAFAKQYEVDRGTLYNWKNDPRVQREVYKLIGRSIKIEWLPNVMLAMYGAATSDKPSVQAAKVIIDMTETTMDMDSALAEQKPIESMSMEELRAELGEIIDLIDDKLDE